MKGVKEVKKVHKLIEYIDDTMQEYEDKVARGGDLSSKDVECLKDLAKTKMAILTNEAMEDSDGGYSNRYYSRDDGISYGSGRTYYNGGRYSRDGRGRGTYAKRDSMGRYSRDEANEEIINRLNEVMNDAPNEQTKQEIRKLINKMENM